MSKTAEELKEQAIKENITFYPVHNCSMCQYQCGYIIRQDDVYYDSGCYCTGRSDIQLRDWGDLARTYNSNQPEYNPKISEKFLKKLNETWKFDN